MCPPFLQGLADFSNVLNFEVDGQTNGLNPCLFTIVFIWVSVTSCVVSDLKIHILQQSQKTLFVIVFHSSWTSNTLR